jgi:hypothetical protein
MSILLQDGQKEYIPEQPKEAQQRLGEAPYDDDENKGGGGKREGRSTYRSNPNEAQQRLREAPYDDDGHTGDGRNGHCSLAMKAY